MAAQREHPLISSIFVRTLMDRRYFHGIRAAAARALVKHAKEEVQWIGLYHLERAFQELFCLPNSPMTRSNDFSDRASYMLQLIIPEAISKARDPSGNTPMRAKRFLLDKLRFNDNSHNEVSLSADTPEVCSYTALVFGQFLRRNSHGSALQRSTRQS